MAERKSSDSFLYILQFKEISFAYDILSNPEKRDLYDRYGEKRTSRRCRRSRYKVFKFCAFLTSLHEYSRFTSKSRNILDSSLLDCLLYPPKIEVLWEVACSLMAVVVSSNDKSNIQ